MRKLLILLTLLANGAWAQNSTQLNEYTNIVAFESFQENRYSSVIDMLEDKINISDEELLLLQLSKLNIGRDNVDEVHNWILTHPHHPMKSLASYHLAKYFFSRGDYIKCEEYLSSVLPYELAQSDRASYGFIKGFIYLDTKHYADALNFFLFAKRNRYNNQADLDYYIGYSHFYLGDTNQALIELKKVRNSENYGESATYLIARIKLSEGQIDEAISLAKSNLTDQRTKTNSGFYQLLGEAYALKGDALRADVFFQKAIDLQPGQPDATLYYQAGVASFKVGKDSVAIKYFTSAGIQGGKYAQLSALQVGRILVKKGAYNRAVAAYIEASTSPDVQIKEESIFEIVSIYTKQGLYTEAIAYAIDYLNLFDTGQRVSIIKDLIAQLYLRTSNYDLALEILTKSGLKSETQRRVYQEVALRKGELLYRDGVFETAVEWFNKSLEHPLNIKLKDQAYFYLGELALQAHDYTTAIEFYNRQSTLDPGSSYGVGYAFFNLRRYQEAIPYFRRATKSANIQIIDDANVRLADCLYATKNYSEALNIYRRMQEKSNQPYLIYQQALIFKNIGRREEALAGFMQVALDEKYGAKALFQSGLVAFEAAQFEFAIQHFSRVIEEFPERDEMVSALLYRAVCYKNLGQMEAAQTDYEDILQHHIESDFAFNAILGVQELEQTGITIKPLETYILAYKQAHPKSKALEDLEFEAAKRQYFNLSYANAIKSFIRFLNNYNPSSYTTEARYYLADSYFRMGELENAKNIFETGKYVKSDYTGRILLRLGEINRKLNNPSEAIEAYQHLLDLNLNAKDVYQARKGLMLMNYSLGNYEEAMAIADEIIVSDWNPINGEQEAQLIKAKSLHARGDLMEASQYLKTLQAGKDRYAVEAYYLLGLMAYQQAHYDQSLEILFQLNANFGSYTQWVDQSYLLMAKNYLAKDELFQAKATLTSIIQHANNKEVIDSANSLLDFIQQDKTATDSTQTGNGQ